MSQAGGTSRSNTHAGSSHGPGHHSPRPFHVYQPFGFLNPTRAHYSLHSAESKLSVDDEKRTENVATDHQDQPFFQWRSRDNRKGRHTLVVPKGSSLSSNSAAPPPVTTKPHQILRCVLRMFTKFPINDISYLVAILFTLGSVVWCINGFFVFLPIIRPSSEFQDEVRVGGSATAFVGATIFEIGAVLMMIEALRAERKMCVGWEVKNQVGEDTEEKVRKWVAGECSHHHASRSLFGRNGSRQQTASGSNSNDTPDSRTESQTVVYDTPDKDQSTSKEIKPSYSPPSVHLIPTNHHHYHLHTIASISSLIQLFGASIFYISGISGLILELSNPNASQRLFNGIFWAPQVIGGTGFIISGWLFMIESQQVWWIVSWKDIKTLGWHVGFWNLIGGIGFTLSGAFGFSTSSGALYQSACSTFWGSWAFLIGSIAQWYETMEKFPVEKQ